MAQLGDAYDIEHKTLRDGVEEFRTLDSGERDVFQTGARRDTQAGKPRYDLIPPSALRRVAELYARGAEKYGDRNWQKGIPINRLYASLLRHIYQWAEGDNVEDHLAAVIFNAMAIMWTEEQIEEGNLPVDLFD